MSNTALNILWYVGIGAVASGILATALMNVVYFAVSIRVKNICLNISGILLVVLIALMFATLILMNIIGFTIEGSNP